jgi:acetylxylan esterase
MKYHLEYFDKWGNEVADFVVARAQKASGITSAGQTSGASDMLKHPIVGVFMMLIVLFAL